MKDFDARIHFGVEKNWNGNQQFANRQQYLYNNFNNSIFLVATKIERRQCGIDSNGERGSSPEFIVDFALRQYRK
jgi:hypothetical protein